MSTATETHAFVDVCGVDDLWDGEMEAFDVNGQDVLIVKHGGQVMAYDAICPHQSVSLAEGALTEDGLIICRAHHWQFRASCGAGVNPATARLTRFELKVEGDRVLVGGPAQSGGGHA